MQACVGRRQLIPASELDDIQFRIGDIGLENLSQAPFKRLLVVGADSGRPISGRQARFCDRRETVPTELA